MNTKMPGESEQRSPRGAATRKHHGSTALIALFFLALCAAMATGLFSLTVSSTTITGNERRIAQAQGAVETGLQYFQYQISQAMVGITSTPTAATIDPWMGDLRNRLATVLDGSNGIVAANIEFGESQRDDSGNFTQLPYVSIPAISVGDGTSYSARITTDTSGNNLFLVVTGTSTDPAGTSGTAIRKASVGVIVTVYSTGAPVLFPLAVRGQLTRAWNVTPDGQAKVKQYGIIQYDIPLTDGTTADVMYYPDWPVPKPPLTFPVTDNLIDAVSALNLPARTEATGATITGDGNFTIPPHRKYTLTGTINGIVYVKWPSTVVLSGNLTLNGTIVFQRSEDGEALQTGETYPALILERNGSMERSINAAAAEISHVPGLTPAVQKELRWWTSIAPDADFILPNGTVWDTTKAFEGSFHFRNFEREGGGNDPGFSITKGGLVAEGNVDVMSNGANYEVNSDTTGIPGGGPGNPGSASLEWGTYDELLR